MSLDPVEAGKTVGLLVALSGMALGWVSKFAERKGEKHKQRREERNDGAAALNTLTDQLQETIRDLRAQLAEERAQTARMREEKEKSDKRADYYQDRFDEHVAPKRAAEMDRQDKES